MFSAISYFSIISHSHYSCMLGARAVNVALGGSHTCTILQNGTVMCWGLNSDGQLGIQSSEKYTSLPTLVYFEKGVLYFKPRFFVCSECWMELSLKLNQRAQDGHKYYNFYIIWSSGCRNGRKCFRNSCWKSAHMRCVYWWNHHVLGLESGRPAWYREFI